MCKRQKLFVAGIGTGVGKTLVSAMLVERLGADYWKPIQAGGLEYSDTDCVRDLVLNEQSRFHAEAYRFREACSPHKAARLDGVEMDIGCFKLPVTDRDLIIEGAGGLMVPINGGLLMVDLIQQLGVEVVLVSRNYLGSINHTLLSLACLKERGIAIRGIVFNGEGDRDTEKVILDFFKVPFLGRVGELAMVSRDIVREMGAKLIL